MQKSKGLSVIWKDRDARAKCRNANKDSSTTLSNLWTRTVPTQTHWNVFGEFGKQISDTSLFQYWNLWFYLSFTFFFEFVPNLSGMMSRIKFASCAILLVHSDNFFFSSASPKIVPPSLKPTFSPPLSPSRQRKKKQRIKQEKMTFTKIMNSRGKRISHSYSLFEWTNERLIVWMIGWIDERMNEWMNEWICY